MCGVNPTESKLSGVLMLPASRRFWIVALLGFGLVYTALIYLFLWLVSPTPRQVIVGGWEPGVLAIAPYLLAAVGVRFSWRASRDIHPRVRRWAAGVLGCGAVILLTALYLDVVPHGAFVVQGERKGMLLNSIFVVVVIYALQGCFSVMAFQDGMDTQ
jgi:hypothetical protein